eukprot:CAMPEP_0168325834 /NCGR_PEP_ID=MMETSP0213-20121227/4930_1 /TAXON_ID=151035 /ORGANISM="Euplotes harpa, Strain FSP1.4" /LENGTH=201 /DNA_ID=CAMNT_0008328407 /DNA_START=247 /DNA_END=852 /DNA_ORIENTATION=+
MTNTFWYTLFKSEDIQLAFRNECKKIFRDSGLYTASKRYIGQFKDWKQMFIFRPRVRFDCPYMATVKYWHDGMAEFGDSRPLHLVTVHIILQFSPDGTVVYGQGSLEPEKFIERINRNKYKLDKGEYYVKDGRIFVEVRKGKNTYCYSYLFHGRINQHSDSFELLSKHIVNVESQSFTPLRMNHTKPIFELAKSVHLKVQH